MQNQSAQFETWIVWSPSVFPQFPHVSRHLLQTFAAKGSHLHWRPMSPSDKDTWNGRITAGLGMVFSNAIIVVSLKNCHFSWILSFFFLPIKTTFLLGHFPEVYSLLLFFASSSKESTELHSHFPYSASPSSLQWSPDKSSPFHPIPRTSWGETGLWMVNV